MFEFLITLLFTLSVRSTLRWRLSTKPTLLRTLWKKIDSSELLIWRYTNFEQRVKTLQMGNSRRLLCERIRRTSNKSPNDGAFKERLNTRRAHWISIAKIGFKLNLQKHVFNIWTTWKLDNLEMFTRLSLQDSIETSNSKVTVFCWSLLIWTLIASFESF